MQAINPTNTHTKFGKDRINTFPSNERKPSVRTAEKAKIICPPSSGVDIMNNLSFSWQFILQSNTFYIYREPVKVNKKLATEFTPLTELQEEKIKDGNKIRQDLTKILEHHCPDSAFVKLMNLKAPSEAPATLIIPKAPLTLARSVSCIDELLRDMTLSESQMQAISEVTQQQSGSADWKEQRVGRCTSSKSKRIFTRVKTIMQKPETDVTCLVKEIMCYNVPTQTRAMKHGLALEPVAKVKFCQVMKRKHKGFRQQDTGLHVCQEKPFIAASPDLLCQCTCHGNTICEVKCPMLFDDITPETYPHLVRKPDNTTTLSTTSEYYFQMQHIMGVTGCQMAYLFVYTPKTYFLESVQFNEDLWNEMMKRFDFFLERICCSWNVEPV